MLKNYIKRTAACIFGLMLFGFGTYINIRANIGLSPWSAFHMGISNITGMLYGDVSVAVSLILIVLDFALGENIGIGSILNSVVVGKTVDLLMYLDILPEAEKFLSGTGILIAGQLLLAVGSYFYMSTELGCGPRDSLMLALGRRMTKIPIGVVRGSIEAIVSVAGWFMGAKIGLGTLMSVATIGICLQLVFRLFKYDPKSVKHENLVDTARIIFKKEKTVESGNKNKKEI